MNQEDLRKTIEEYIPFNEQEAKDKKVMLDTFKIFKDVLTRDNLYIHFSASAIVVDENMNKTILLYHNKLKGYAYPGGHADGEADLLSVAIREVKEETNLDVKPVTDDIFTLQLLPYHGHYRHGIYVPTHTHMDILYLLMCDYKDMNKIRINEEENSDVRIVNLHNLDNLNLLSYMNPAFEKGREKIKRLKKDI